MANEGAAAGDGPAIEVRGLTKAYGSHQVLRGIDLHVAPGECFAVLGPNGAGKTTTVEILEGYRDRDGGEVRVLGADPAHADRRWRERVGIVLQSCELEDHFSVRETLEQVRPYYPNPRGIDEVIEMVGLGQSAEQRVGRLSGGQQRRLDVGCALIGDPDLLFLDEPTTGFDPSARRTTWALVERLKAAGTTVLLTTHYLDEAQALADRVAIVRNGTVVATGAPAELVAADQRTEITFTLPPGRSSTDLPGDLGEVSLAGAEVTVASDGVVASLHALTTWALEVRIDLPDLGVRRPSLEDVYLELTASAGSGDGGDDAAGDQAGPAPHGASAAEGPGGPPLRRDRRHHRNRGQDRGRGRRRPGRRRGPDDGSASGEDGGGGDGGGDRDGPASREGDDGDGAAGGGAS